MGSSHLAEHVQDIDNLRSFQQERLLVEAASAIYQTMTALGMSRSELAARLGVTKGRVTQYLGGERNLTLRTLADIFTAMQARVAISSEPLRAEGGDWEEIPGMPSTLPLSRSPWKEAMCCYREYDNEDPLSVAS